MMKTFIRSAACAVALVAVAGGAQAIPVLGQGTWETTLQGRDLDGNLANGAEAFYDTDLQITWLADANRNGLMNWGDAKTWASSLNVFSFTGWRLPETLAVNKVLGLGIPEVITNNGTTDLGNGGTASELGHLYYVSLGNLGFCAPSNAAPQGCVEQSGSGLSNTGPFTGLQPDRYWSGTSYAPLPSSLAWEFDNANGLNRAGFQYVFSQSQQYNAMAVHDGDIGTALTQSIPEPHTYALMLAGLSAVAWATRRHSRKLTLRTVSCSHLMGTTT